MAWEVAHIGPEQDDFVLEGVEIWRKPWKRQDGWRVKLPHPQYPKQHHLFDVYEIAGEDGFVRFAATELSPGGYGFYKWTEE